MNECGEILNCADIKITVLVITDTIVAKRSVLEQKLLLKAYRKSYEKSIGTKMNDLGLCLEVVSRSRQPLHYIRHWNMSQTIKSRTDRGSVEKDHQ